MQVTDKRLDNGIRVLTGDRRDTGSIVLAVNVSVGSLDELHEEQWGAAHFLEHMAFKGTKTRDRLAVVREVEGRGGIINAQTSHDGTVYYIVTTPRHFEHTAEILHDILCNSIFPQEEFDKERNVVLEEIKQHADIPFSVLWRKFDSELFRGRPRAHPILGTKDTISALTRDALLDFRSNYLNDTITVAAVGNIKPYAARFLAGLFSKESNTEPSVSASQAATLDDHKRVREPSKFEQCYQFIGMEALNDRSMFETPAACIATTLLGEGMSSLLFQKIREELGIAYSVGALLDSNLHNGSFVAYSITDPCNADAAADATRGVLARVAAGDFGIFGDDELNEARERVIGPMYTQSETNLAMAFKLIYSAIATGQYLNLKEREERYRSVTRESVMEFISRMLSKPILEVRLTPAEVTK